MLVEQPLQVVHHPYYFVAVGVHQDLTNWVVYSGFDSVAMAHPRVREVPVARLYKLNVSYLALSYLNAQVNDKWKLLALPSVLIFLVLALPV